MLFQYVWARCCNYQSFESVMHGPITLLAKVLDPKQQREDYILKICQSFQELLLSVRKFYA